MRKNWIKIDRDRHTGKHLGETYIPAVGEYRLNRKKEGGKLQNCPMLKYKRASTILTYVKHLN